MWLQKTLHKLPLAITGLALVAGLSLANADEFGGLGPDITIPESSGDSCVLPKEEIRRDHPDLLKHDRNLTLREGKRTEGGKALVGSLKACVNCHAVKDDSNQYVRIDNQKHFCVSCHKYAAVTIDCFQCHRDIPEGEKNNQALMNQKSVEQIRYYGNITPGIYNLTHSDMMAIKAPEVKTNED